MAKCIKSNASSNGKLKVGAKKSDDGSKGPKQPKPIKGKK